jgi:hypothetical protein
MSRQNEGPTVTPTSAQHEILELLVALPLWCILTYSHPGIHHSKEVAAHLSSACSSGPTCPRYMKPSKHTCYVAIRSAVRHLVNCNSSLLFSYTMLHLTSSFLTQGSSHRLTPLAQCCVQHEQQFDAHAPSAQVCPSLATATAMSDLFVVVTATVAT